MTREDIFYATYALLHHPNYRARFAENLKRELPRLPLDALPLSTAQWAKLVHIGTQLGDLHTGYETIAPAALTLRGTAPKGTPFSFRVERMPRATIKPVWSSIRPSNCPALAPRCSIIGWAIAAPWIGWSSRIASKTTRVRVLHSAPDRADKPRFIADLIGRVANVSLQTMALVGHLPALFE